MTPEGTIRTGARRDRVPVVFEPVIADAIAAITEKRGADTASLYLYGSVATGVARPGRSDVDLLSVDLRSAAALGRQLSARYADRCRSVEIAPVATADLDGETDEAYGNRVFVRHYCVHLAGPDHSANLPAYPADARAARGFNGDLDRHLRRWRRAMEERPQAVDVLGSHVARKTLLAVAGMVSVHDRTWTTDRTRAARRWAEIEPGLDADLSRLLDWAKGDARPTRGDAAGALGDDGIVAMVVERFAEIVGLWRDTPTGR